jgi:hypothetical protein
MSRRHRRCGSFGSRRDPPRGDRLAGAKNRVMRARGETVDHDHMGAVRRSLTSFPSRRDLLRGLAATGIGLGFARLPSIASARKRPRQGNDTPKPKPNKYGCLEVGDPCGRASQCCSGICKGKKGKKTCRAHGTATCPQRVPGVCTSTEPELLGCGGSSDCFCFRTTAGSNYCGDWFGVTKICHACKKDVDCEALGLPRGSACVPVARGHCTAADCEIGMMCMAPCGYEPPAPETPATNRAAAAAKKSQHQARNTPRHSISALTNTRRRQR